jgi:hypothetical protein
MQKTFDLLPPALLETLRSQRKYFFDLPGDNGKSKPFSLRRVGLCIDPVRKNMRHCNHTAREGMLFFPFCPLSSKEKEIGTQRPQRL